MDRRLSCSPPPHPRLHCSQSPNIEVLQSTAAAGASLLNSGRIWIRYEETVSPSGAVTTTAMPERLRGAMAPESTLPESPLSLWPSTDTVTRESVLRGSVSTHRSASPLPGTLRTYSVLSTAKEGAMARIGPSWAPLKNWRLWSQVSWMSESSVTSTW